MSRALLLIAVTLSLPGCARWFLLHPTTSATRDGLRVPHRGGELQVVRERSRCGEPELFVLELLGNAARAERGSALPAAALEGLAVETWILNYPGYGSSDGRATLRALPPAARAAFDHLASHAGPRPIVVFGNSLGATVAIHLAAERDVAAVVVQNPPPLRRIVLGRFGYWNLWLLAIPVAIQIPHALDPVTEGERATAPLAVITADEDELVWPRFQDAVYRAYGGPKRRLWSRGRGHDGPPSPEATRELRAFLHDVARRHGAPPRERCRTP